MKGFTLIETLVYISLFGLLLGGAVVSTYQVLDGGVRTQQAIAVQEEGNFLLRKLDWEVGQADSARIDDGALLLQPGSVIFSEAGGRIFVERDGEEALPITPAALTVAHSAFTAAAGRVQAEFDIQGEHFMFERSLSY